MTSPAKVEWAMPCCELHGRNCEPPSELCCPDCTEADHPGHRKRGPCSNPDLSPAIHAAYAQADPAVGRIIRPEAVADAMAAVDGQVSGLDPKLLALLDVLAGIYDAWTTEAHHRQQGASGASLFGPKQMILAAEGSVMLACADELRQAVAAFGESQGRKCPYCGDPRGPAHPEPCVVNRVLCSRHGLHEVTEQGIDCPGPDELGS